MLDLPLEIGFVLDGMRSALATATPTICNSDQGSHFKVYPIVKTAKVTFYQWLDLLS